MPSGCGRPPTTLAGADLRAEDFAEACARAQPGDFVYLDPPYQPLSATSAFTKYTGADFGFADQERLRDTFDELTDRGVPALLSNSSHPDIDDLYRDYEMERVPSEGTSRAEYYYGARHQLEWARPGAHRRVADQQPGARERRR